MRTDCISSRGPDRIAAVSGHRLGAVGRIHAPSLVTTSTVKLITQCSPRLCLGEAPHIPIWKRSSQTSAPHPHGQDPKSHPSAPKRTPNAERALARVAASKNLLKPSPGGIWHEGGAVSDLPSDPGPSAMEGSGGCLGGAALDSPSSSKEDEQPLAEIVGGASLPTSMTPSTSTLSESPPPGEGTESQGQGAGAGAADHEESVMLDALLEEVRHTAGEY